MHHTPKVGRFQNFQNTAFLLVLHNEEEYYVEKTEFLLEILSCQKCSIMEYTKGNLRGGVEKDFRGKQFFKTFHIIVDIKICRMRFFLPFVARRFRITFRTSTRLSSIESQPKKIVVVVMLIVIVAVIIVVGHKNLTLKFNQNWVNNK